MLEVTELTEKTMTVQIATEVYIEAPEDAVEWDKATKIVGDRLQEIYNAEKKEGLGEKDFKQLFHLVPIAFKMMYEQYFEIDPRAIAIMIEVLAPHASKIPQFFSELVTFAMRYHIPNAGEVKLKQEQVDQPMSEVEWKDFEKDEEEDITIGKIDIEKQPELDAERNILLSHNSDYEYFKSKVRAQDFRPAVYNLAVEVTSQCSDITVSSVCVDWARTYIDHYTK